MPMTWGTEDYERNLQQTRHRYARRRTDYNLKSMAIVVGMLTAMYFASEMTQPEAYAPQAESNRAQLEEMDRRRGGSTTGNPEVKRPRDPKLGMPGLGRLFGY